MKIRYLGHSCFELTTSAEVKLITDPYTGVGYELPADLSADIVTVSHGHFDHAHTQAVRSDVVLRGETACSYKGVQIRAIKCYHDEKEGALRGENLAFIIKADGWTFCHLGDIGEPCSAALVKKIGKVDALFVPVGGTYTVDARGAKAYVDAIAPKIVFPMHHRPKDGSLDITDVAPFLSLYEEKEITRAQGEMELTKKTQGVIYLERAKT